MIANTTIKTKFPLGRVLATPGVLTALATSNQLPQEFLRRHATGDWGALSEADARANEESLVHDDRLLSSYRTRLGATIWIITEADRSSTTLLLPEEY